jgi:hypothetical protein
MGEERGTPAEEYLKGLRLHSSAEEAAGISVRLVCGCCGHIAEFPSYQAAFEAGWDTPDRFGYSGCDRCPGVAVYFPLLYAQQARDEEDPAARDELLRRAAAASHMHDEIHEKWQRTGRPGSPSESEAN